MNSNNNEPIVLGELKKEKSSKPFFVFLVFAFILGTCFGLPYIQDYLANGDGPIVDFYNKILGNNDTFLPSSENTTTTTTTLKEEDDGLTLLKNDTILNAGGVYLENIIIKDKTISYKIMARKSLNLDLLFYYLEIYDANKVLIQRVKLTGYTSSASKTITVDLTSNVNSEKYYLKFINLEEESLSDLNVAALTCTFNNNTYVYNFADNKLISINHDYTNNDTSNLNTYLNNLTKSNEKSALINTFSSSSSKTTQNENNYTFTATLDLSSLKIADLGEYIDYNYYDYGTLGQIVKYDMIAKGFDCK